MFQWWRTCLIMKFPMAGWQLSSLLVSPRQSPLGIKHWKTSESGNCVFFIGMTSTVLNPVIFGIFKFVSIRRDRVIPNLVLQLRELHATGLLTSADGRCADVQMSVQIPYIECHFPYGPQNRHWCFCHSVFPSSYSKLMTRKYTCDTFEPQPPQRATAANAGHSEPPRCLLLYTCSEIN